MEKYILTIMFIIFVCDIPELKSNQSAYGIEKINIPDKYSEFNYPKTKRNTPDTSDESDSSEFEDSATTEWMSVNVSEDKQPKNDEPIVKTDSGTLRGLTINKTGVQYFRFSGIPYAEKPIRFQSPKPVIPWEGIRNATKAQSSCPQKLIFMERIAGDEDCLYMNINTPTLRNEKLPVLVWIFGGAFKFGTANNAYYGPERLMEANVTLVTLEYRMGALGFLATNTEHAPGNIGLKDIVMGLRWIKKNIQYFGGDSENISLYGVSSGAASVEYLTLSPMARGLYHKAIVHSGSVLCDVFHIKRPLENAFKLGKYMGLNTKNITELMIFLQNASMNDIVSAQEEMDKNVLYTFHLHFVPNVEEYQSDEVFLNESPEQILRSGEYDHVPMMFGFNDKEGLYFLTRRYNMTILFDTYKDMYEYMMPPNIMNNVDSIEKRMILQESKEFYFKNKSIGMETIEEFIDFLGDSVFSYGIYKSVEIRSKTSKYPPYYYQYAHTDKSSGFEVGNRKIMGSGHADDLRYVFRLMGVGLPDAESEAFAKKYINLFTNFMRFGNPTPPKTETIPIKWPPVDKNTLRYLKMTDKFEMKENPFKERYAFWDKMYAKCH